MEHSRDDRWLLQSITHSTYPIREEKYTLRPSILSSGNININIQHPEVPAHHEFSEQVAVCASGWTEPRLDTQSRAIARIGMTSVSFNHPRQGALRDLWSILQASRKLRANWRELSSAVWDERDLEHAEYILVDMLSDQVSDKDERKTLLKGALKAGRYRRDNLVSVIESIRERDYNVHLLGHSLGGIDTTIATKVVPEHVSSLTLAAPGGLMVNDTPFDIIPRIANTVVWERTEMLRNTRELARMAINTALFVAENPILTLYEGGFAATSKLEKSHWDILADHHIPIVLILGGKDKMFPTSTVTQDVRAIPYAGIVLLPEAGHNLTLHQASDVAKIMSNVAIDVQNRRSGQLEVNMNNLIALRRHQRPQNMFTVVDMEDDLFSR